MRYVIADTICDSYEVIVALLSSAHKARLLKKQNRHCVKGNE